MTPFTAPIPRDDVARAMERFNFLAMALAEDDMTPERILMALDRFRDAWADTHGFPSGAVVLPIKGAIG